MNFKLGNDDITLKYEYTLGWVIYTLLLLLFIYLKTSREKKQNLIKFYNVKGIFYSAENRINVNILIIHSKTTQYCLRGPKFNFRNNININLY